MLQGYNHLHSVEDVNLLPLPDFNLLIMCMYNLLAIKQGVDPEKPPESSATSAPGEEKPDKRKMSAGEFLSWRNQMKQKETE